MGTGYKTTRVWPIPRATVPFRYNGAPGENQYSTISVYDSLVPSGSGANYTAIRLCSIDLWVVDARGLLDFACDVIVGIGKSETIIQSNVLRQEEIPLLDKAQTPLTYHAIAYGVTQGGAGIWGIFHGRTGPDVFNFGDQVPIGCLRNRRPLHYRWGESSKPRMELWKRDGAPIILGVPWMDLSGGDILVDIMGMVTFEADQ